MVMKRTQSKHLMRTIRKNGVSFFAVAFIATTSIAIFLGFQSTADAILKRADRYFTENRLESLEISCANGITKEDIDTIAGWEGIDAAEGGYSSMVMMDDEEEIVTLQALSLSDEMNVPVVIEGALPASSDEAAVEEKFAKERGLSVGDTVTLRHDGELNLETFHVTAIINQPMFCCANIVDSRGKSTEGLGAASYYICLTKDAFDASYYDDCFTVARVRNDSMDDTYYFSDEYTELEASLKEKVEELGEKRAQLRYTSLEDEAQSAIDDAQEEIDEAEEELADGRSEIDSKQKELDEGLEKIEAQLNSLGMTTDLNAATERLELLGEVTLPLRGAITEYQDGAAQLADARAELEEAEDDLSDAKEELADAKEEASEIELKEWIVAGRNEVGDVRGVRTIVDGLFGLSYSMSVIFLLVAIIVCHAAITKMIDEQRMLIGAQKALGFRPGEILKHYMMYNTLSALLGIFMGYVLSVVIVELLVLDIYKPKFLLGGVPLAFAWKAALLSAGICLFVFLAATYSVCAKLVRLPSTTLLRGEVPVRGKRAFFENWKCYKKLNLYSRTMIKNVLNDKGRMMTTIMGVVGCISLLVICITLKLAMSNSSIWQFDRYFLYENRLVFDSSSGSAEDFEKILEEEDISFTRIHDKLENFRVDGGIWENGRIAAITDTEGLKDFMALEDIDTKEIIEVPSDGLLVSRRCAEEFGLSAGSAIEFMDSEGKVKEFRIAGVIEHYLAYHLFVTTESYFEETMGEAADPCVFLLKGDISGLYEKVKDIDGFLSLKDNSEFDAESDTINPVIGICLLLSAAMSLLVLLNQIVMHINRKARELAVMRINGYTLKETRAYIYKDNIILTVLGLLLGCGFGAGLAYVVVRAVEVGAIHNVRTPSILACLCGCAVVSLFAFIVNLIALRKIKYLNLTNVSGN